MKNTIKISTLLLTAVLLSFTPVQFPSSTEAVSHELNKAAIKWKTQEIELGNVVQNKPVIIEFEFTNIGESSVVITNVQASCGCTSTNYPKTPVLSGETTKITAVFNAAAKGAFKKQVTVVTSAEEIPKILVFSGTVI